MKSSIRNESTPAGPDDGPEEGEIVSDELEDISDESIICTPINGKSLSRSDHLHALSLSSVTDFEEITQASEKSRKRKKSYCRRHAKRKRRREKVVFSNSDSSDDDTTVDRRLRLQLKAAIQVDVEDAHKNSLRTRLRAMAHPHSEPESYDSVKEKTNHMIYSTSDPNQNEASCIEIDSGTDSVISVPELSPPIPPSEGDNTADTSFSALENHVSDSKPKDEVDSELIQLRLEALKTALTNKFANRKRRRKSDTVVSDDTNKENTNNNSGDSQDKKTEIKVEIPRIVPQSSKEPDDKVPPSPDEDEDVLRALLLASMSKKITSAPSDLTHTTTIKTVQKKTIVTNIKAVPLVTKPKTIHNFNSRKVINNVKKNVVNKVNTKLVKMPQVKPLIIKVNADSDSDFDLNSPEKSPKKQFSFEKQNNSKLEHEIQEIAKPVDIIESSVDKFLREQRAKVESEIKSHTKTNVKNPTNVIGSKKDVVQPKIVKSNTQTKNITLNKVVTLPNTNKSIIKPNQQTIQPITQSPKSKLITVNVNVKRNTVDLDKSALNFLPEKKREEYKQLQNLLKLKRAQLKKPRVRKPSNRNIDNPKNVRNTNEGAITPNESAASKTTFVKKNIPITNPVSIDKQIVDNLASNITSAAVSKEQNIIVELDQNLGNETMVQAKTADNRIQQMEQDSQESKSDAFLLHTTLKLMQTRKDGRLQIQERYKSLRPLIKKINIVSKEQKHWDHEVKILLEQLSQARRKQQGFRHNMSSLVNELAHKKHNIDESLSQIASKPKINSLVTSTPLKHHISDLPLDISAVNGSISSSTSSIPEMDNKNQGTESSNEKSVDSLKNTLEQSTLITEQTDVKRVASDTELTVSDPNDIDKIIKKTEETVAVLKKRDSFEGRSQRLRYVSPLDAVKRKEELDPFAIMCPFEVDGMCKDSECTFKHLPK